MSKASGLTLRLFIGLYSGTFLTAIALSAILIIFNESGTWSASAMATVLLAIFGSLGIALTFLLWCKVLRPVASIVEYTNHILAGTYGEADDATLKKGMPILGDAVGELTARYKERLGFSQSMLQGLPVPICIVDTKQIITFLNKECLEMIGSTENPESYYGRTISQIFYKDDRKSLIGTCMDEKSRAMNREAIFKHVDDSDINVLANLFPLTDVEDTVIGGCCLYLNTTELKQREAQIICQSERIATAAVEATSVSDELATAAVQLEGIVRDARDGTCAQTERTGETATAMEEMNATVLEVARHAQEAAADADEAKSRAEKGASIVTEVVSSIDEVAVHAEELKTSMEELDTRAESIGKVLGVIEDIADQTNLLALNAAIEAARAGEAGRGFAVVADEVRKLAEKTMQATNEVHAAITGIQDGARKNVKATEVAVNSVAKSIEMASQSGEALTSIVAVAEATADRVRSIATAAEQQSAASEEINQATMDVNTVCGETELRMIDASDAIVRLAQLAETLSGVIRKMQ